MNLLNVNNVVHIFLNKIGDIVISNLLFLLCCIPIVTIGPSFTALYHCMLRSIKGNDYGTIRTFFCALKENFVQSLIVWLGMLAAALILITNIKFLLSTPSAVGQLLLIASFGVALLLFILLLYVFPVIAAFSNTTRQLVKNAFAFAFLHIPSTLAIAAISTISMIMTCLDLKLLPLYAFCWFFFGFGLTAYLNSLLFYRMFKPYLDKEQHHSWGK